MSNSYKGQILFIIVLLVTIGIVIGSGVIAWNWIKPDNFFESIGFLIVWSILSTIGRYLAVGLGAILDNMMD